MEILKTSGQILLATLVSACAHAEPSQSSLSSQSPARLIDGVSNAETSLSRALEGVKPGSIVIIGENHGLSLHQKQQLEVMKSLRQQGHKVSLGMEFFYYPTQNAVNSYRAGTLPEDQFLLAADWGGTKFDFYRDQVLFPQAGEGSLTWALNAPRALTKKVAKEGLENLSPDDAALLPPGFQVGREPYKERFLEIMPHLPSPAAGDRYFAAQSVWDDTMAWRASEFIRQHPEQTLVIIVGEFHVLFGGGLPDRLQARAPQIPVLTLWQFNTSGQTEAEIDDGKLPSAKYGKRADLIWLGPAQN